MSITITEAYLSTEAEKKAKDFCGDDPRHVKLDKGQLRKFYDEFKILERKMDAVEDLNEDKFKKEIYPLLKFVISKIAYNAGRKVGGKILVCQEFKTYIEDQIKKIESIKDFKSFILHYQAIIGFYTYLTKDIR